MNTAYTKLVNFVDDLIRSNAIKTKYQYSLSLCSLDEAEKEEFAAYFINYDSTEGAGWDWLLDDISREELASQFALALLSYKDSAKTNFTNVLYKSAFNAYESRMRELLEERLSAVEQEDMQEAGLSPYTYRDNGEAVWR